MQLFFLGGGVEQVISENNITLDCLTVYSIRLLHTQELRRKELLVIPAEAAGFCQAALSTNFKILGSSNFAIYLRTSFERSCKQ